MLLLGCTAAAPASPSAGASSPITSPREASPAITPAASTPGMTPAVQASPGGPSPQAPTPPAAESPTALPGRATPSSGAVLTPGPDGWTGPALISERQYHWPSLAVDRSGAVHVAAQLGRDVFYVTNATGSWTRERLTEAPRGYEHAYPLIAADADGSMVVTYSPRCLGCAPNFPEGVQLLRNSGSGWSQPTRIADGFASAIAVRGGAVHVLFDDLNSPSAEDLDDISRPLYGTDAGGAWAVVELADVGAPAALRVGDDGSVHVAFWSWVPGGRDQMTLRHGSTAADGQFALRDAPLPRARHSAVVGLDRAGQPHVVTAAETYDPATDTYTAADPVYARLGDGGWQSTAFGGPVPEVIVVDGAGRAHVLFDRPPYSDAATLVYSIAGGQVSEREFGCCRVRSVSDDLAPPGLAIDSSGRVHVFFATEAGTWHGVGQAP